MVSIGGAGASPGRLFARKVGLLVADGLMMRLMLAMCALSFANGAMFTGITNGGQFCYHCVYNVDGGKDTCKVFLTYNPTDGTVSADY